MKCTIIKSYFKSLKCHYTKYIKHKKYKHILKYNRYFKIKDVRNEFKFSDKLIRSNSIILNKND
uniref:Ribosomal protein S17 n=1 Tax=Babesia orientalis TaxID=273649 RepID=A0A0M4MTE4_9APIC|nr:ribosomal protein S17 [Babesia orientalis]ALE29374.1 ribosomal protein S17 [Babesia orientalis]